MREEFIPFIAIGFGLLILFGTVITIVTIERIKINDIQKCLTALTQEQCYDIYNITPKFNEK